MPHKALAAAAAFALLGVVALRLYMQRFEQEASGGPKAAVLVVAADLPAGSTLTREALGTREVPALYRDARNVNARDLDAIVGTRLAVDVHASEALLWTDLASMRPSVRKLAGLVPEGMRAMTLNARSGAFDELLEPGDRVDVLLSPQHGEASDASTSLIAESLLVLAVGEDLGGPVRAHQGRRGGGPVTVSVSLDQGRALADAERSGALRLVLRNPDDVTLRNDVAPHASQATVQAATSTSRAGGR